jgi:ABC-type spermidine/putrescine transport system permease subunit II
MAETLTSAVLALAVVLSLVVCLIGVLVAVALGFLAVLVLADLWDIGAELASKRGRRRARLLRRLARRQR